MSPSPPADRRTLIRRVTFDLLGLPPTPEEVVAFEADPSPDAYARLVDRLLASPRYGERWGRHWLDVARYADTKGYILFQDADFHWAYTYRDYVIAAFNRDTPYDRFIVEQLAADQIPDPDASAQPPLAALGFLTLGGRFMGNFHDVVDDRIDVVCRGLMSLTVTCARCHDHKFDPIPTRDYYSLYGVLASAREPMIPPEAANRRARPLTRRSPASWTSGGASWPGSSRPSIASWWSRRSGGRASISWPPSSRSTSPPPRTSCSSPTGPTSTRRCWSRWQSYLARPARRHDPVFAPWHALAALPPGEFARRSAPLIAELVKAASGGPAVNPVVARRWPRVAPARWPTWRGSTAGANRVEALGLAAAWAGLGRTPRWPSPAGGCAGRSTARTARSMYRSTPSACWPCCPTGRRRRSTMSCATPCRSG